jgi:Undecaprenyl-phosphate galactose phosphotransferase WbaP
VNSRLPLRLWSAAGPRRRPRAASVPDLEGSRRSRPSLVLTRAVLVVSDAVMSILAVALTASLFSSSGSAGASSVVLADWSAQVVVATLIGMTVAGLYPGAGHGAVEELRRAVLVTSAVHGMTLLAAVFGGHASLEAIAGIGGSWLVMTALISFARAGVRAAVAGRPWWGVPVVILGAGRTARLLVQTLRSNPGLDLKVMACFDDDEAKRGDVEGIPVLGPIDSVPAEAARLGVHRALVAMPGVPADNLSRLVQRHASVFREIVVVPNLFGLASLGLTAHDLGGVVALTARQNLTLSANRVAKRALDLALLVPLSLAAIPVLLLGVLAVQLVSPGRPFYAQRREGRDGRPVDVWKLRTMRKDAEAVLDEHLAAHPEARAEWAAYYKLQDDPRVLPLVGHFLRRTSIDEVPQLWNIVRGEMSFVGPRPFPEYHLAEFDDDFRDLRRSVVPGLTGLWQVSARSEGDLTVQRNLDTYYIRNWSVWLDIYLLARTPFAVLFSRGAY